MAALQAGDEEVAVRVGFDVQPGGGGLVRILEIDNLDGRVGNPLIVSSVEDFAGQQVIDFRRGGRVGVVRPGNGRAGERLSRPARSVLFGGRGTARQPHADGQ